MINEPTPGQPSNDSELDPQLTYTLFRTFYMGLFAYVATLFDRLVLALATSWPIMLLLGALHSVVPQVPAFGYWATLLMVGILAFASILMTSIGFDTELRMQRFIDQNRGIGKDGRVHSWATLPHPSEQTGS